MEVMVQVMVRVVAEVDITALLEETEQTAIVLCIIKGVLNYGREQVFWI
jgi:hypothetical protein